jgi:hypothetical protein
MDHPGLWMGHLDFWMGHLIWGGGWVTSYQL